ncbi:MAG TPA: hypothetical protein DCZ03_07140 [Gammaproteobacteria bacterium]|nr:hypothetical protein [Gammaproteobacteria bacterium]
MPQYYWFHLYVALHLFIATALAMRISWLRIRLKIPNGDGKNITVRKAIRAHGNSVEHAMLFGLGILSLSIASAPIPILSSLVLGFTLIRISHSYGMLSGRFNFRRLGAAGTYFFELAALIAIVSYCL